MAIYVDVTVYNHLWQIFISKRWNCMLNSIDFHIKYLQELPYANPKPPLTEADLTSETGSSTGISITS